MASAWTDWVPDAGLASEVDGITGRTLKAYREDPNLITEHANHEESIRVGGYANRTLLELVQNAADAMAGVEGNDEGVGRVEIVLDVDRQTLYCANAGRPFSRNGLNALAHAYLSGKRGMKSGGSGLDSSRYSPSPRPRKSSASRSLSNSTRRRQRRRLQQSRHGRSGFRCCVHRHVLTLTLSSREM
ncbi:hypothetical protein [Streptomyces sp. MAR4 CNX-425]|uniref:hypothetical protein n=1 Tax=Streptomyces sp. MAR4 CNX-425 TaxID=3406343 RepID=UPI003B50159E